MVNGIDLKVPLIGILRGISADFFGPLMDKAFEAGLQAIEVTFNTQHAEKMVAEQISRVPQGKYLDMGTIRNLEEAKRAVDAGAMFMVAGVFTPTEVYKAWSEGADMVKIFPCDPMAPEYIRALLGPFDRIPLLAVGGVTREI